MTKEYVMTKTNWKDWLHNARLFAAPVLILYLSSVAGTIAQDGHVFSLNDFRVTTFIQGGITLYVLNSTIDWIRKWKRTD